MPRSGSGPAGPPGPRRATTAGDLSRLGRREDGAWARGGRGAPYLVPIALAAVAGAALWLGRGRLASCAAVVESPETQIRRALAHQDRAQLDDVYGFHAGGTLALHDVRYDDVVTSVEGGRATVTAMITAQGRAAWRDQEATVAYVGRERFHMRPCAIALWCGEGDQLDRLRGVLLALFRRRDAEAAADPAALGALVSPAYRDGGEDRGAVLRRLAAAPAGPPARVVGWQVRVERERAEAGEDLVRPAAAGAGRPERHLYRLALEDGRWRFVAGL